MEDSPTTNLTDLESSSGSLEDFSYIFASSTVSKPKHKKSIKEILQEQKSLANDIKEENISQMNVEEKLKQIKKETPCEDEKKTDQSVTKEFTIFCVKDSLQFFNSRDVTPLLCGYDNRSEELTAIEKNLLTYVRVELEHVLSSFLLTCHPCSISDCKSFVKFLLYHISVSHDTACVNACYHRLLSILSEHPHAQDISFSSAEIFMLLFNYGIDVENCELLKQKPGIKKYLGAPKCKKKSSNKIPDDWTYNLQVLLDSFIKLVSTCEFKPRELCNILLFLFWMSLDSTLLKNKFYIVIQDTISSCMERMAEDKLTTTLYELASVLMSLQFSSVSEKWNNIYSMIELVPPTSEMCIYLRRHISFLALKLLCADSEIDTNLCEFSLDEFKALLQSFVDINSDMTKMFVIKFADLCLSHLNADKEDYIELCSIIKQSESLIKEHAVKSHICKIHSRLKILVGKVSSWPENSNFGIKIEVDVLEKKDMFKIEVDSLENKDMSKLIVKTEPKEFSNDGNNIDTFFTTSSHEAIQLESSKGSLKNIDNADKSPDANNIENMESENNLDSNVNKIKLRRLSENMYYVASIVLEENADNPELTVPHPNSDVLEVENENNCNETYSVCNLEDYNKVVNDCIMIDEIIPQPEFSENNFVVTSVDVEEPSTFKLEKMDHNSTTIGLDDIGLEPEFSKSNIVVASVTSCADSSVDVEPPATFKMEKINIKSEGYNQVAGYEYDMINDITPQDEFAGSSIVVSSVTSCADSSLDAEQPVILKFEKINDVESTSCNNPFLMQEFVSNIVETAKSSNELSSAQKILVSEAVDHKTDLNTDSSVNCVVVENPSLMKIKMFNEPGSTFNETKALNYSTINNPIAQTSSRIETESDTPMPVIREIKSMSNVTKDLERECSLSPPHLTAICDPDVTELSIKDDFYDNTAQNNSVEALGIPSFDLDSASSVNLPSGNQSKITSLISPDHPFMASPKLEEFIPLTVEETGESLISHSSPPDGVLYNLHTDFTNGGGLFKPDLLKSVSNLGIAKKLRRHSRSTESFPRTSETVNEILTRNTESFLQKMDIDLGLNVSSRSPQNSSSNANQSDGDEIVFLKEVESPTKCRKSKNSGKHISPAPTDYSSDKDPQIIFVKNVDSSFRNKNSHFSAPFRNDTSKDNDAYAKSSHDKVRKEDDIIFLKEKYGKPAKQKKSTNRISKMSEENRYADNVKQWFPKTSSELQILPVGGIQNSKSSSRSSSIDYELDKLFKNSNIEISLSSVSTSSNSAFPKSNLDNDDNEIVILKEIYLPCKRSKKQSMTLIPLDAVKSQLHVEKTKSDIFSESLFVESSQINSEPIENADIEDLKDLTPAQVENEYIIPEDDQSSIDLLVSELVHQLIENVSDVGIVCPEADEVGNEKALSDKSVKMNVKPDIKVASENKISSQSSEDYNSDNQLKTEVINCSVINKQKHSNPLENLLSDEILSTDNKLNALNKGEDLVVISEKQSNSDDMPLHNVESHQNNTVDLEVVGLLISMTRSIVESQNQLDTSNKSPSTLFKTSVNSAKINSLEKDSGDSSSFSDVMNTVSMCLKDLNVPNKNEEKENTKLEKINYPTVIHIQKHMVAKMSATPIPLINSNHCVKTSSSSSDNALNTNAKSVSVLDNNQNKLINSSETGKSKCTAEKNSLSILSNTNSKLNRKRKNSECSYSISKMQKVTDSKTDRNLDAESSRHLRNVKTSPCKQQLVFPKKSKVFAPTHYHRKRTSPFKSNFKTSPKKTTYSRLRNKAVLSKRGLALSQYLRNKMKPSSSEQIPKPIIHHISDSDSNSDVEILYCDPKKYSDRDCIILYESEDLVVLD